MREDLAITLENLKRQIGIVFLRLRRGLLQGLERLGLLMILKLGIGEVVPRLIRSGVGPDGILEMANRRSYATGA